MISIGVDLGGSVIKIGLLKSGNMIAGTKIDAHSDKYLASTLPTIEEKIKDLLTNNGITTADCLGVGIAFPGIIDIHKKKILTTVKKYEDAVSINLEEWSQERLGLDLVMENDANAALLGEYGFGCAKGVRDVVMMILGTGVGTAAIIDGNIIRGKHYQAGDFGGHLICDVGGKKCACGGRGCLETFIGTWALPDIIKNDEGFLTSGLSTEEKLDYKALQKWKEKNDVLAEKVFNNCIQYISAGIVNMVHAYDPELVVLSGGVMKGGDIIFEPIKRRVKQWAYTPWGALSLAVSENPEASVLLGLEYLLEKEKK